MASTKVSVPLSVLGTTGNGQGRRGEVPARKPLSEHLWVIGERRPLQQEAGP
jgi:hypothetical protein